MITEFQQRYAAAKKAVADNESERKVYESHRDEKSRDWKAMHDMLKEVIQKTTNSDLRDKLLENFVEFDMGRIEDIGYLNEVKNSYSSILSICEEAGNAALGIK